MALTNYDSVKTFLLDNLLVDTSYDADFIYNLMIQADVDIATHRPWMILRSKDSSKTASVGDTYATTKALPTDYLYTRKMFVGEEENEYIGIPFEEQIRYRNSPNRFFVDIANSTFALTGSVSSNKTIYHFYIKTPTAAAAGVTPVWPAAFRSITAYRAAQILAGNVDADEMSVIKRPNHMAEYKAMLESMERWDAKLQMAQLGGRYSRKTFDYNKYPDRVSFDIE